MATAVLAASHRFRSFFSAALATYEIDHRFIVWGEAVSTDGQPVPGETIYFAVGSDSPIGSVVTDKHGGYRVLMHLHDADLGRAFDMTVRGIKEEVKIEIDPADEVTERGKAMDFATEK